MAPSMEMVLRMLKKYCEEQGIHLSGDKEVTRNL